MADRRGIVVVGGGLAGARTIQALRRGGHDGPIRLLAKESALPYDRPPLSKEVLIGTREADSTTLLDADELARLDVSVELGTPVSGLDLARRAVRLGTRWLPFAALVIATGSDPVRLRQLQGCDNVHVLRTAGDAKRLRGALRPSASVLVLGAGVIGCEVAASARTLGCAVTMVDAAPAPMLRSVGPTMAVVCGELHRRHGTQLRCGVTLDRVEGAGRVERAVLSDGTEIAPDVVVVGVGAAPSTSWLEGSGLTLGHGVVCDARLCAGPSGVYAAGDVACFPRDGTTIRSEHWTNATEQARHVAQCLLDPRVGPPPFAGSDYVWSDQYGTRIQVCGASTGDRVVVVSGAPAAGRFLAWYQDRDRVVGALAIGEPRLMARSRALVQRQAPWTEALSAMEGDRSSREPGG
jgi:NADPH-dependent 2,4-dienoyl-CoA reductase/sulfur reductase-like enzyme